MTLELSVLPDANEAVENIQGLMIALRHSCLCLVHGAGSGLHALCPCPGDRESKDWGSGIGDQESRIGDWGLEIGDRGCRIGNQELGMEDWRSGIGGQGSGIGDW